MPKSKDGKNKRKTKHRYEEPPPIPHRHLLYEAAVQSVDADLDLFARVYRRERGKAARLLREDFCGTAALACEWVRRNPANRAWGVDIHRPTLEWGRQHRVTPLGRSARRVTLVQEDVRSVTRPRVDLVAALNFSYSVFKDRETLRGYFAGVRSCLRAGGIFFVDVFGGSGAMSEIKEKRKIPASRGPAGEKIPAFTYIWEQASFNAIDHHIRCHIHFRLKDGRRVRRAFTYDWRLWTLPELRELMLEAGFKRAEAYMEGWDEEEDDADGIFRRRRFYENQEGWVGYMVGFTS
jgi:cyclopropane fatty-acyl-phospholipid synthase-like methyltransferase